MQTCPTCGDFYEDGRPSFCLADGTPLAEAPPDGDVRDEGARVLRQKAEVLRRRGRRLRWRRVATRLTTTLITVAVVCVAVVNSLIYLAPAPPDVAQTGTPPPATARPNAPPPRAADPTRTTPTEGPTTLLLPLEPTADAAPAPNGDAGQPSPPHSTTPATTPAETTPTTDATDTPPPPPPPPTDAATPTPTPPTTQPATTPTPAPSPVRTATPPRTWTPTWTPAQGPTQPPAPAECSDADRRHELQRILAAHGGSWRRGVERERPRVIAEFARADNAEATLGDIAYEGAVSRDCKAASVTLRYVWRVLSSANGEPRVADVPRARRLACARLFGSWVCR